MGRNSKGFRSKLLIGLFLVLMVPVVISGGVYGCGGGFDQLISSLSEGGGGGDGGGTPGFTAPAATEINTALKQNNPNGMVPDLALGAITLPACTATNYTGTVTYALSNLPAWLSFETTTRAVSLAAGTTVPATAYTASSVTHTCTAATDSTVTSSTTFTINDLDADSVTDGYEYKYGAVPLLNNSNGWIWLNPRNVNLYRPLLTGGTQRKIPTGITVTTSVMDPNNAADAALDFDGDLVTNLNEILAGTDIFVAPASAGLFNVRVDYSIALGDGRDIGGGQGPVNAADFNGDGILDIVATDSGNQEIRLLPGNGDGTFGAVSAYDDGGGFERGMAVADFNNDGVMDVAVSGWFVNRVTIAFGDGIGSFVAGGNYDVDFGPCGVVAADFNGDGNVDVATANNWVDDVSILINNDGTGTFPIFPAAVNYAVGAGSNLSFSRGLIAGDFNNDGRLDLAAANWTGNSVSILMGNGDGTFAGNVDYTVGTQPSLLIAGDFNGDGDLDLAISNRGDNSISVLFGAGDGTFGNRANYAVGTQPWGIIAADLFGSGYVDIAVGNAADNNLTVLRNNGTGTFTAYADYATGASPFFLVAADFNRDGKIDLATANSQAALAVSVLLQP
ncbi:MAG: VCBS repeat-containing protein [Pseudomonadota bacterium]